jgi:hypothetical protein
MTRNKTNTPKPRSRVGSARDLAVFESVAWARCLTRKQIQRLHFPSPRTAQRRLAAYVSHGYLRAHRQGDARHVERVFTLTPLGAEYLSEHSDLAVRATRLPGLRKLEHALAVRNVFVAFVLGERRGALELEDFRFEEDLVREPAFSAHGLVPDGVAALAGPARSLVAVECDLGTETTTTLRAKLGAWKRYMAASRLGAEPPTSLMLVVRSPRRALTLERLAAEAELGALIAIENDLDAAVAAVLDRSRDPFAPPVRAERIGRARETPSFRALRETGTAAFRASRPVRALNDGRR